MTEISLSEGFILSIGCIITVFIVLIGLQFILTLFKFIGADVPIEVKPVNGISLLHDSETEEVAVLMALILANGELQDKKYQLTEIKRIK
ncbi:MULTISPECIES: OadG family protein [Carnobacterium]|uniref:OadG family protein n=1 Tax=Carnobacterium TaxID=2747 RepID=UPI00191BC1EC|nr:OadG family protein [Carnobacterium maltaromaticum]CAD5896695.1 Oxaloacetate decarboxylase, gamma chain [Carnobacterium maltaromaticum]